PDFETGAAWIAAHDGTANYGWGKEAMLAWVQQKAYSLTKQGIRINALMPGPTNTPLARANAATWLGFGKTYRAEVDLARAEPIDQAAPLVFLCSDAARYITGIDLMADGGLDPAILNGQTPDPIQD